MFFRRNKVQNKLQTTVLRISGMHCTSCSMSIDDAIEELPGVESSKTNYAKANTEIHHTSEVQKEQFIDVIRGVGYEAEIE